jgi:hypothetical protein
MTSVLTQSFSDVKFEIFKILLATLRNGNDVGSSISEEINHLIEVASEITKQFLESCDDERMTLEEYLKEYTTLQNQRSLTMKEREELQNGNK